MSLPGHWLVMLRRFALAAAVLALLQAPSAFAALGLADLPWLAGVYDDGDHDDLVLAPASGEAPAPPPAAAIPRPFVVAPARRPGVSLVQPLVLRLASPRAPPA